MASTRNGDSASMSLELSSISPIEERVMPSSVELAYALAIESFKQSERRLEVVEKRLQEMMAFGVTITLGITAVCAGKGLMLRSVWFESALISCIVAIIIGIATRLYGGLELLTLSKISNSYLGLSQEEFKYSVVKASG